jgi:hypothetical protein
MGDVERVPVGELPTFLARYLAANARLAEEAGPWLQGLLPAPVAQLHALELCLRAADAESVILRGEMRAVLFQIRGEYARNGGKA